MHENDVSHDLVLLNLLLRLLLLLGAAKKREGGWSREDASAHGLNHHWSS
jgi:hypothetical protein